jgi:hypothetical protein
MAVAARYRGDERSVTFGRRLIGPELFPTYQKVLTINAVISLMVGAVLFILGGSVASAFPGIFLPLLIQFAAVTSIFMAIDRRYVLNPDAWDPRTVSSIGSDVDVSTLDGVADQLIGPTAGKVVRVTTSVLEFGLLAVVLTVWLSIGLPAKIDFMAPGPGWTDVWLVATVLIVVSAINSLVTLVRPSWTRFRIAGRAFVDLALVGVLLWSFATGSWLVLADASTAPTEQVELVGLINTVVRISIAITIVITALSAALEIRRFRQLRPT